MSSEIDFWKRYKETIDSLDEKQFDVYQKRLEVELDRALAAINEAIERGNGNSLEK